jgi:hypothetical protein
VRSAQEQEHQGGQQQLARKNHRNLPDQGSASYFGEERKPPKALSQPGTMLPRAWGDQSMHLQHLLVIAIFIGNQGKPSGRQHRPNEGSHPTIILFHRDGGKEKKIIIIVNKGRH